MPLKQKRFSIVQDDLTKIIDVDASDGRSVPINMNFTDKGFLTKDTGFTILGITEAEKCHSLFYYKKDVNKAYIIRARGTKLQTYNMFDRTWTDIPGSPTFTEDKEFGYIVYDGDLYFCNGVDNFYKWNGITFTAYPSAPKGNILEIFEDRMFVAGVSENPLTIYYSKTGVVTNFNVALADGGIIKPLGTDEVTNLKNYYGTLLVFKKETIWKITFVELGGNTFPKFELQSGAYGACSKDAAVWVENDIWFFTGQEVRAIGYTDTISGVFGVNRTVISEDLKETLKLILEEDYDKIITFYKDRRFYLAVPNTLFVCHTLHSNSWTKYEGRDKSKVNSFTSIGDTILTSTALPPFGVLKWNVDEKDTQTLNNSLSTE